MSSKGYKHTEEAKNKIRLSKIGSKNPCFGKIPPNKGKTYSEEIIEKIKEARARQVITTEHKEKISLGLKRAYINGIRTDIKEKKRLWKGDQVGYGGLHNRVRRELGTPDTCEHCKKSGLKGRQIHWANKSGMYHTDMNDWLRLCVSCHKRYDLGRGQLHATNYHI